MLEEEGIGEVERRYARTARGLRAGVAALGLEMFPDQSTSAVSVIKCPSGIDGTKVVSHLQSAYRVRITNGQDQIKGKVFRVGHMGIIPDADVVGLVHVIERALADLGHRRSRGAAVAAVQDAFLSQE